MGWAKPNPMCDLERHITMLCVCLSSMLRWLTNETVFGYGFQLIRWLRYFCASHKFNWSTGCVCVCVVSAHCYSGNMKRVFCILYFEFRFLSLHVLYVMWHLAFFSALLVLRYCCWFPFLCLHSVHISAVGATTTSALALFFVKLT